MAEVSLDRTSILTSIGKDESTGVPKHTGMNFETNPRRFSGTSNHPVEAADSQRISSLRYEDERRRRGSVQFSESPELSTAEWMHRWCPILEAIDVEDSSIEVDLLPFQVDELRSPQAVPETDQDGGRVPISPAVCLGQDRQQVGNADIRRQGATSPASRGRATSHFRRLEMGEKRSTPESDRGWCEIELLLNRWYSGRLVGGSGPSSIKVEREGPWRS